MRRSLLAVLLALTACTASRAPRTVELLDEQSGNTLLVVDRPLVFARDRSDVAAHARDYATLVAVEIDDAGKYSDFLLLYRWSTVDPRMSPPPDAQQGELRILADGRAIELAPLPQMPIGLSRRRGLHLPQERLDMPFELKEDGRAALSAIAAR